MKNTFLAFDLGTTGGRAIIGELTDGILSLQEIYRFENVPVLAEDHKVWNIEFLFQEIKKSLVLVAESDLPVESIGITAWGGDFSIMGDDRIPLRPFISRDVTYEGSIEGFAQRISADKIYGQTGVPVSHVTSLFQLSALKKMESEPLKKAKHLLFIPDIFNYLLTGNLQTEFSIATTSQLYNPVKRMWDHDIFKALGIPVSIMSHIVESGSIVGSVSNNVSYETGIARIPVVAVASLDTASAIAAIPTTGNKWVYIITGSNCQMGYESARPVINKKSQQLNFTNQGGAGPTFHIQQSLNGLNLLDECFIAWKENNYTIAEMITLASESKPFTAFIDTDHASFLLSENLPGTIKDYCKSTDQYVPQSHGEIIRTILEGLALKFRIVVGQIELLSGFKTEVIYMTGEGSKIDLLCQLAADCCGIPVLAYANETVAAGNSMMQALALGIVKNVAEIREITGKSFPAKTYEPTETEKWNDAYEKYMKIMNQSQ